ncbi:aminodeoxychorismate lyase [Candidatus Thiothrix anitrata]|jgi:4-amino-4-deoxychorismate lyase|uniref:Aminodeoxychorismate lyase n=1 Tax=Candidatus Thiothrix anitrata TaxID=2823902 RepID=A0ABX7X1G1_9GAMM|nr:aminodeoxychorismate lyase [Candidatus Thiothrix anitrata]QTR49212.1 aminodeoxychorismate lyase [Candidatus Thiothrix anitrata]
MIWVNGVFSDTLPITDRGLLYGDGVWETLAILDGRPLRLNWHLERLQQGLQALAIPSPDMTQWLTEILKACRGRDSAVLKLIVTRGQGMRGYNPRDCCNPTRIVQVTPRNTYPASYVQQGIRLALCETRLAQQPRLAGFKHLNRLEQVLARAEFDSDFQEGLVRDTAGNVIEGTMSNVFLIQADSSVVTPALSQCGVAGVMRRVVLQALHEWGIPCRIGSLSLDDMHSSQAIFMTNSLIGIWPVREFMGKTYPVVPLISALHAKVNVNT